MDRDERVYMVMAEDENGDGHLFASDDRGRAEAALVRMTAQFGQARANWLEPCPVPQDRVN